MSASPRGRTVTGNRWDELDGIEPAEPPRVSIVVVHHEQPRALARTLDGIARQDHPAERREVIVVDDGSRVAPAVPPGVELLRQEDRGERPGAARNRGARRASGDVLCFLDADTAPEQGYLRALTRLPAIAPEAVTVGRRRHADFGALPADARAEDGVRAELAEPAWLRAGYRETADLLHADERSYRYVISSVLACTRWFFDEVGPFAEWDAYGGEDWDWAHRAWRRGAVLAHVPAAVAWHDGPEWAARVSPERRRPVKNDEALRLARLIGVPGARGRAIRPARAETVVRVLESGSPAAAFVCVDSLLGALPEAVVTVPGAVAGPFAGEDRVRASAAEEPALAFPRLEVTVHRPVEVDPAGLRAAAAEVLREGLPELVLADARGPLLTLSDARARARARRWGAAGAAATVTRRAEGVAALEAEPDVEAWLGGWGSSRLSPPTRGSSSEA